jgi:hypothetical protein
MGLGLNILEVSRSRWVGLLWMNDRPDVETSLPDNTQHSQEPNIHGPTGSEPAVPASEWPQTDALNRVATWMGSIRVYWNEMGWTHGMHQMISA